MNIIKRLLEKYNKKKRIKYAKARLQELDHMIVLLKDQQKYATSESIYNPTDESITASIFREQVWSDLLSDYLFLRHTHLCEYSDELGIPKNKEESFIKVNVRIPISESSISNE